MARKIMSLRASKDEGVWIDDPCIDQSNEAEKIAGIGCMIIIYRAARRMIVVLEDVRHKEDEQAVGSSMQPRFLRGSP